MKIICVNDKNKPSAIPNELWPIEGQEYTLIDAFVINKTTVALELAEIDLEEAEIEHESGLKYKGFNLERFGSQNRLFANTVNQMLYNKTKFDRALYFVGCYIRRTKEQQNELIQMAIEEDDITMVQIHTHNLKFAK